MPTPPTGRTIEAFLAELADQDLTIRDWARLHQLDINTVYMAVSGRIAGTRGEARRVIRAMGLTPPPVTGKGTQARARARATTPKTTHRKEGPTT